MEILRPANYDKEEVSFWLANMKTWLEEISKDDPIDKETKLKLAFQALDSALVSSGLVRIIHDDAFENFQVKF